ncbi:hypothetical protein KTE19_09045 [Lentilactobacillus sp. IMAU92037]|uniref:hypothetical protein n=1 Tax=Lentilactobacillus TaxID=2767893 RepID=UPI001C2C413A|nr:MULTISPECIES: hypothetical protein [Lentilactobacillus]MBV0930840.1 hypothetical protein [Lentilactobacillus dabitei]MDM7515153.1 hypothetical protein [Lentilactobacillus sp. TOM.63]
MKQKLIVVGLLGFFVLMQIMIQLDVFESLNLVLAICAIIALVVALMIVIMFGKVRYH